MTRWTESFKKEVQEVEYMMSAAETKLNKAVSKARNEGLTWDEIANEVGLTKQGAWARWAKENNNG